jgi:hypothetical protein
MQQSCCKWVHPYWEFDRISNLQLQLRNSENCERFNSICLYRGEGFKTILTVPVSLNLKRKKIYEQQPPPPLDIDGTVLELLFVILSRMFSARFSFFYDRL